MIAAVLGRMGRVPAGFAVLAVGGYGRGELAPGSDVDLLLLCGRRPDTALAAVISDFQYYLWDLGYHLGSSARTSREVESDARADPHFLTSLLSARRLGGDAALVDAAAASLALVLRSTRKRFVAERLADAASILERSEREVLVKEPDLKQNAGGLRTVHLMQWLARATADQGGSGGVDRFLPPLALRRLERGYDFLLYLRSLLHLIAGRREDLLRIEWQLPVADSLGLRGSDGQKMVKLMRHFYERATDIVLALQLLAEAVAAETGRRGGRPAAPADPAAAPVPARALEVAARAGGARTGALIAVVAAAARTIDSRTAGGRELFVGFRDLLLLPHSYPALTTLKLSGFLYAYVRPLRRVRHRIVHNPFHRYTVDQHSLEAVRELESFAERAAKDPDRYELPARVAAGYRDSIWVVKLALLLHDAGKAYEGDHAKNSAEMARTWLQELPTESLIKDMIIFLVENHLLLSAIARRGDLESEEIVGNFASELARQAYPAEALDLLYLVTCADIAATNERAYSGYAAATLATLFLRVSTAVSRAQASPDSPSVVEDRVAALVARGAGSRVSEFVRTLGGRYSLANTPADILADFRDLVSLEPQSFRLRVSVFNDHLRVKVIAADRVGLFSLLSGILLANGADIVRARIHTYRGTAIDEFIVTDVHGNEILEQKMEKELSMWIEDLRASFERYWVHPEELDRLIAGIERRTRPVDAAFARGVRVAVERRGASLRIDVACTDRPALLYDLTHRMASLGLNVHSAAVDTTGWDVHDSFDTEAQAELDDAAVERVRAELAALAVPGPGDGT